MNSARVRGLLSLAMNAGTSSDGGRLDDDGKDVLLVNRSVAITNGVDHSTHSTLELLPAFTVFATTELLKSLKTELLVNLSIKRRVTSLSSHNQDQGNGPEPRQ
jgi:hypothetical protein